MRKAQIDKTLDGTSCFIKASHFQQALLVHTPLQRRTTEQSVTASIVILILLPVPLAGIRVKVREGR